jgi:nucleoside-diphosphate-sugar epimerase
MDYTILGGRGFIGSNLVDALGKSGHKVLVPKRDDAWLKKLMVCDLGHVFYCIGVTADFRNRPFDTVKSHVCLLRRVLEEGRFDSLTYLSSTRVYQGAPCTCEDATLSATSHNPDHLYNLSKLLGESLCLNSGRDTKVVRLSNVYGSDFNSRTFLSEVLRDAACNGRVVFRTSPESAKDYVAIEDVVRWLPMIAAGGKHRIYNLASGRNATNDEIASRLLSADVEIEFAENAPEWCFQEISVDRVAQEFGEPEYDVLSDLPRLLETRRAWKASLK